MPTSTNIRIGASGTSSNDQTVWVPLNQFESPFNTSFGVYASGDGTSVVQVQHTFNDVLGGETAHVFSHEDVSAAALSTQTINTVDGNYAFPIQAMRLQVTSASGASSIHFLVNQAGV